MNYKINDLNLINQLINFMINKTKNLLINKTKIILLENSIFSQIQRF